MVADAVYIIGAFVTMLCAVLLMRGYLRVRRRLLFWSALCFFGLSLSNALVFVDMVLLPNMDLYRWRLITATIAMALLLFGLIWEGEN
jgi:Family of unknown function (DUF5985)